MKYKVLIALLLFFCLHFEGYSQQDIGVSAILSPGSNFVSGGTNAVIVVLVKNYGTTSVGNFLIWLSIDNVYLSSIIVSTIPSPGSSEEIAVTNYVFPCKPYHHFKFYTDLAGDINPSNDALYVTLTSLPNLIPDTIKPAPAPYWSGTVSASGYSNNSMVQCQAGQSQMGWITFDASDLVASQVIDSATLVLQASAPYQNPVVELVHLSIPPVNSTAPVVWQALQTAPVLQTVVASGSAGSIISIKLNAQIVSQISNSIIYGNFTLGFKEISPGTANVATFQGALQAAHPYIILHSAQPFIHDVGVSGVSTNPPGPIPTSPMMVEALISNHGMNTETVNVVCTGTGGYTSTVTNVTLMPGSFSQITFPDLFNPPPGPFCLQVETQLPTDQNCLNDLDTLCYSIVLPTLVNGSVHYASTTLTPLYDSTFVHLVPMNPPGPVITDTVDLTGFYEFVNPAPGSYVLMASSSRHWKGVNATDAMKAMQHYVGMIQLTGLKAKAADVNGDGWINSLDALLIARRFVGQINSFPVGDWIFEDFQLQINTSQSLFQNIPGIIAGDTDGSY